MDLLVLPLDFLELQCKSRASLSQGSLLGFKRGKLSLSLGKGHNTPESATGMRKHLPHWEVGQDGEIVTHVATLHLTLCSFPVFLPYGVGYLCHWACNQVSLARAAPLVALRHFRRVE